MRPDTLLALAIVVGAVTYLVRRAVLQSRARKAGGPGCDNCPH